ncbi:hypothetical protein AB0J86_19555 [Micromonospora sp. NPDC049559]
MQRSEEVVLVLRDVPTAPHEPPVALALGRMAERMERQEVA